MAQSVSPYTSPSSNVVQPVVSTFPLPDQTALMMDNEAIPPANTSYQLSTAIWIEIGGKPYDTVHDPEYCGYFGYTRHGAKNATDYYTLGGNVVFLDGHGTCASSDQMRYSIYGPTEAEHIRWDGIGQPRASQWYWWLK